jgi:calcium-dependent protein kinase
MRESIDGINSQQSVLLAETGELGYKTNFNDLYAVEEEIGKGAFGTVSRVVHKATAQQFACKSIPKSLPGMDEKKQQEHLESVQREIFVLKQLRSCLNVAKLEEVFESESHVHIVQELCLGGELEHSIGKSHYSERTVRFSMVASLPGACCVQLALHFPSYCGKYGLCYLPL